MSERAVVLMAYGSPDRIADYLAGLATMADVADYLTINISSPNTPGLRDLLGTSALTRPGRRSPVRR